MPSEHALFTLCLNALLCMLDENMAVTQSGSHSKWTAVIAFANVTIILRSPKDFPRVQETLRYYEAATGAKLNNQKSKAMALGSWDTSQTVMGIPYHDGL